MQDESDRELTRLFATAAEPLADSGFTARVSAELARLRRPALSRGTLGATLVAILSALGHALATPLRSGYGWLMFAGAAVTTVWAML
jgi:hypothetical protein